MNDAVPPRLEDTDPELAETIRKIACKEHPVILGLDMKIGRIEIRLRNGSRRVRTTDPNSACPCGSGRKFKKCCRK